MHVDQAAERTATGAAAQQGAAPVASLGAHVRDLLRLAVPVVVARAGLLVMALVDTIIVGNYGTTDLAHLTLGTAILSALLVTGIGLVQGTLVMTANAFGRSAFAECGAVWLRSMPYAAALGLVGLVLGLFGAPFLAAIGQTPSMATGGGAVMAILGLGLPAALMFTASAFFLEGLKRPLPGMLLMIAANLVNLGGNWVLVYGHLGFPELGAVGSAWATTITRIFLAAAIVGYILKMPGARHLALRHWPGWRWRQWQTQRRIGYGAGLAIGLESLAFTILTMFAGLLGETQLGAYAIVLNLLALIFMVAVGLGAATAVRVGIAHGRRDWPNLAMAGWTGLGVNTAVMAGLGLLLLLIPETIAHAYSNDPVLIPLAAPLIAFAATILIADGGQVVMGSALRGRNDVLIPTLLHGIAYMLVMVPLGYALGVAGGRGVLGLYEAILIASIVAVLFQAVRFGVLARRDRIAA